MKANVYKCKYKDNETKKRVVAPPFYNLLHKSYTYNIELDSDVLKIKSLNNNREMEIRDIYEIEIGIASALIPKGSMQRAYHYYIDLHVNMNNNEVVILEFNEYSRVVTFVDELKKLGVKIFDPMNLLDIVKNNEDVETRIEILNNLKAIIKNQNTNLELIEQNRLTTRYVR